MVLSREINAPQQGVTLIELAIGIMLMAIIGVTVSSLVRAGVEMQMHQRMMSTAQVIVMNVVDDLRYDLRTATNVTIPGAGNTLTMTAPDGTGISYVYNSATSTITRTNGAKVKNYSANTTPALNLVCSNPCFAWRTDINGNNRSIVLGATGNGLEAQAAQINGSSVLDQTFPATRWFSIRQASFDVISNATYD